MELSGLFTFKSHHLYNPRAKKRGNERNLHMYRYNNNNNSNNIYLTAIGLLPVGSGCIHVHIYEKRARNLKPGKMHELHAVAT